jgi:hypothetical protein
VAPTTNTSISANAAGLANAAFASCRRRRGIVSMGYDVLVPEMMNNAATATYVTTHIRQTILSSTSDAYAMYSTKPRPAVDSRKT